MLLTWGSRAAYYVGDEEAAFRLDSRAVSLARTAGALGDMLPPLQRLALSEILLGHWPSAAAHGIEAATFATETGQPNMASLPTGWLALLAAYRGDTENLHVTWPPPRSCFRGIRWWWRRMRCCGRGPCPRRPLGSRPLLWSTCAAWSAVVSPCSPRWTVSRSRCRPVSTTRRKNG